METLQSKAPDDRDADPAPSQTERQMLNTIMGQMATFVNAQRAIMASIGELRADVDVIKAETSGTSTALHEVDKKLVAVRYDAALAVRHMRTVGTRVREAEDRIDATEEFVRGHLISREEKEA